MNIFLKIKKYLFAITTALRMGLGFFLKKMKFLWILIFVSIRCVAQPITFSDEEYNRRILNCKFFPANGPTSNPDQKLNGFDVLIAPLTFKDTFGNSWVAPKGTLTDGASIPFFAQFFLGEKRQATVRRAATIHDAYCAEENKYVDTTIWRKRSVSNTSRAFFEGLVLDGCPSYKAKIFYTAVYLRGPQWPVEEPNEYDPFWDVIPFADVSRRAKRKAQRVLKRWIKRERPEFWLVELATRYTAIGLVYGQRPVLYPKKTIESYNWEFGSINKEVPFTTRDYIDKVYSTWLKNMQANDKR